MASCLLRGLRVRAEEVVPQTRANRNGDHDESVIGHEEKPVERFPNHNQSPILRGRQQVGG